MASLPMSNHASSRAENQTAEQEIAGQATVMEDPVAREARDEAVLVPVLIMTALNGALTVVPIDQREITIGRDAGCDVRILSPHASRRHATIAYENIGQRARTPSCVLYDNDSHNGTQVNGVRVERPTPLHAGDTIVIGGRSIAYFLRTPREVQAEQALREKMRERPATVIDHRFPINEPATISFLLPEETFNPYQLRAHAQDLSLRGVRLTLEDFPEHLYSRLLRGPRYAKVRLESSDGEPTPVLHGRVAWVDHRWATNGSRTSLGIEFENLSMESRQLLNDYLSSRVRLGG